MPFKDLATVDSILMRELPSLEDVDYRLALKRLIGISMGVVTPLSEQLTKPLPNAIVLVNLKELSTGAYKLLLEGTRLAVSLRGDEPYEELDNIKNIDDITMILHEFPYNEDKLNRVHAARRLFEYLEESSLNFHVIHHIQFPKAVHSFCIAYAICFLIHSCYSLAIVWSIKFMLTPPAKFLRRYFFLAASKKAGREATDLNSSPSLPLALFLSIFYFVFFFSSVLMESPAIGETVTMMEGLRAQMDSVLIEALENPRHRLTVLRMEFDIQRFMQNPHQYQFEFQHLPTSYLRCAAHRVAQHYGLQTMALDNSAGGLGSKVIARKTSNSKFPAIYLSQVPSVKQTEKGDV
ncbi:4-hydroxy-3-methylbut-2-en-1-yl diphosphate synthase (ferredoxin), chloroplastic [Canna indica]|uniref:4-hydroxy-3-methylbut-2-en-1-yl diphosphate synthase (Ferredoxin), chloroplastic n=1 Tax=Canna indica TaxID=4628 RepID=A0AAQ3QIS5_9LILI|nr:4-hydroxy-3-methylbut-2-en-1-yl diphosphate synthase (ferredoxin), chloroplastic [Canna indica]